MISNSPLNQYIGSAVNLTYAEAMKCSSDELRELLFTRKTLVFKNWKNLTAEEICQFSKKFGTPWSTEWYSSIRENACVSESGEAYTVYSDKSYPRLFSGIPWHADIANEINKPRYPARILYCLSIPSNFTGLTTDVSNMELALSDMSESDRDLMEHTFFIYQSWQQIGTNIKALSAIEVHPVTGAKFLRLNAVSKLHGWIRGGYTEYDGVRTDLDIHYLINLVNSLSEKYKYSHVWEVGDLIIWDNWATIHQKAPGVIADDSTGLREFVRISVDTGIDPLPYQPINYFTLGI